MEENRTTCPCCPNHCEADALQCGKGRAYFGKEEQDGGHGDDGNSHGSGNSHHRHGRHEFVKGERESAGERHGRHHGAKENPCSDEG